MEEEKYTRDFGVGEQLICNQTKDYPKKVGNITYKDIYNIRMMVNATRNQIILVRGYKISEHISYSEKSDESLDGAIHIALSLQ